ncbi:MAG: hypothetical protein OXN17_15150 [Candidatus Poribacteria bacterium]|nr:hypothetical protein [Candidatus Poribacteria bacterium]MDE0506005.1 hypothetical protein [Candidatus Poribacteria bacterium]
MGIWDTIMIIALFGIAAELVKFLVKTQAKSKSVGKDELTNLRDTISTMQIDLDEIKTDLRTVVIQMDDLKLYKVEASVVDEKD